MRLEIRRGIDFWMLDILGLGLVNSGGDENRGYLKMRPGPRPSIPNSSPRDMALAPRVQAKVCLIRGVLAVVLRQLLGKAFRLCRERIAERSGRKQEDRKADEGDPGGGGTQGEHRSERKQPGAEFEREEDRDGGSRGRG